jgi:hypothetical protein
MARPKVNCYVKDNRGSVLDRGREISLRNCFHTAGSGAHTASYAMDKKGTFSGVKRTGREADHSRVRLRMHYNIASVTYTSLRKPYPSIIVYDKV